MPPPRGGPGPATPALPHPAQIKNRLTALSSGFPAALPYPLQGPPRAHGVLRARTAGGEGLRHLLADGPTLPHCAFFVPAQERLPRSD